MKKYIAYYRVSTKKQNLGLEAQQSDVTNYLKTNDGILLAEYQEKESGTKKGKRIEIYKALQQAKKEDAILLVAKIDRLTRDVEFLYSVKNSGVKFQAVDIPDMNEVTVGVMAVLAENEAKVIRKRIVSALNAKRKRGEVLGNDNINIHRNKAIKNSVKVRTELARINNQKVVDSICDKRKLGLTFEAIATSLNDLNYTTSKGSPFIASTVYILHNRYCK